MHQLMQDFAEALRGIDRSGEPFKAFAPGAGGCKGDKRPPVACVFAANPCLAGSAVMQLCVT